MRTTEHGPVARLLSRCCSALLAACGAVALGLPARGQAATAMRPRALWQRPAPLRPPGRRLAEGALPASPQAAAARARQLVLLFLRVGTRQPYAGEEVTRLLTGRVRESRQTVKHAGPGRERIEYLSPPAMRGQVLLLEGGRLYRYVPGQARILDGPAPVEQLQRNLRLLVRGVRQGSVVVSVVGTQIVAGQPSTIVEIKPSRAGARYKRLWIDERTGVRLRTEDVGPLGDVTSTTYFTSIDYAADLEPRQFQPASLPDVPHVPLFPRSASLGTVQAAQQQVGYTPREPAPPPGYRLSGVWVGGGPPGRQATILRYSDGVNTFALFQRPLASSVDALPAAGRVRSHSGVAHWRSGAMAFTVVGALRPEALDAIVASVR